MAIILEGRKRTCAAEKGFIVKDHDSGRWEVCFSDRNKADKRAPKSTNLSIMFWKSAIPELDKSWMIGLGSQVEAVHVLWTSATVDELGLCQSHLRDRYPRSISDLYGCVNNLDHKFARSGAQPWYLLSMKTESHLCSRAEDNKAGCHVSIYDKIDRLLGVCCKRKLCPSKKPQRNRKPAAIANNCS